MLDPREVTITRHEFTRNLTYSYLMMSYGLASVFVAIDTVYHGLNLRISEILLLVATPVLLPLVILWASGNYIVGHLSVARLAVVTTTPLALWCLIFALIQVFTVRWKRFRLRSY